jgi:hypothetical protein
MNRVGVPLVLTLHRIGRGTTSYRQRKLVEVENSLVTKENKNEKSGRMLTFCIERNGGTTSLWRNERDHVVSKKETSRGGKRSRRKMVEEENQSRKTCH